MRGPGRSSRASMTSARTSTQPRVASSRRRPGPRRPTASRWGWGGAVWKPWRHRRRATFVLIRGAGPAPRVYASTIEMLGVLGHDALAPPLPLDDQAARPSDHAEAIARALPSDAEIVIVAQS